MKLKNLFSLILFAILFSFSNVNATESLPIVDFDTDQTTMDYSFTYQCAFIVPLEENENLKNFETSIEYPAFIYAKNYTWEFKRLFFNYFHKSNTMKKDEKKELTFPYELNLPSGKTATISDGQARHAIQAGKLIGGDQTKFISAMISVLVKVDNQPITFEYAAGKLPLRDFNALAEVLMDANFI